MKRKVPFTKEQHFDAANRINEICKLLIELYEIIDNHYAKSHTIGKAVWKLISSPNIMNSIKSRLDDEWFRIGGTLEDCPYYDGRGHA